MSISNEIQKLQTNLTNSYEACSDKGATMPASQNFDNLADCIDSIPTDSTLKRTFVLEEEINHVNTNNITTETKKIYNYTRYGKVVDNNGIVSGFRTDKYLELPNLNLGSDYEINFTFTPADFDADRPIISGVRGYTDVGDVFIGGGNGKIWIWDGSNGFGGNTVMSTNSKYSFKLVKNGLTLDMYLKSGSPSEDINDYTLEFSGATDIFSDKTIRVGVFGSQQYFPGTVDMNESYIKWSNYVQWLGVTKSTIVDNYSMTGHVAYNNGVLSDFYDDRGTDYYAYASSTIPNLGNNPWEFECGITTGSVINTDQEIIGISTKGASPFYIISSGLRCFLSSDGANWDICNTGQSYLILSANTTYRMKIEFTGTEYKISRYLNGEWNVLTTVNSSTPIHFDNNLWFGVNMRSGNSALMFRGSINTNYCVLKSNGNIIWQGITQNN